MPDRHVRRWAGLVVLVTTGCASPRPSASPSPSAAPAPAGGVAATPEAATRAAFDQYVRAFWSEGDTTALARALSPTMIYHYNGRIIPGDPERHLRSLHAWRQRFPDLTAVTDAYTGNGAYGAAATTWTGGFRGMMCGKPGTGQRVSWSVNYVFRVTDGRMVELWETWDEMSVLEQLGNPTGRCDAPPP